MKHFLFLSLFLAISCQKQTSPDPTPTPTPTVTPETIAAVAAWNSLGGSWVLSSAYNPDNPNDVGHNNVMKFYASLEGADYFAPVDFQANYGLGNAPGQVYLVLHVLPTGHSISASDPNLITVTGQFAYSGQNCTCTFEMTSYEEANAANHYRVQQTGTLTLHLPDGNLVHDITFLF